MTKPSDIDELVDWILFEPQYTKAELRQTIETLLHQRDIEARIDEAQRPYREFVKGDDIIRADESAASVVGKLTRFLKRIENKRLATLRKDSVTQEEIEEALEISSSTFEDSDE